MSEAPIDQTRFAMEAPSPQPQVVSSGPERAEEKNIRKPISLPIFVFVLVLILGLLLGGLYISQRKPNEHVAAPTPVPTDEPVQTNEIRSQIQPYFDQIDGLNPEENDHPFPPVDFTVRIKDPNAKSN